MIEKVRCVDATAKQMAIVSNSILKKSLKFAKEAYAKNIINSQKPRFTQESIKEFYKIGDFYDKNGKVKKDVKPLFSKVLSDIGLKKDATLGDFAEFIIDVYK